MGVQVSLLIYTHTFVDSLFVNKTSWNDPILSAPFDFWWVID
jgi:hypothetical protein